MKKTPQSCNISKKGNEDIVKTRINVDAESHAEMGIATNSLQIQDTDSDGKIHSSSSWTHILIAIKRTFHHPLIKKIGPIIITVVIFAVIKHFLHPGVLTNFLMWMEAHPMQGIAAYTCIYPLHTVLLLPATPMVMGAGYIFKVQYGWVGGVCLCTFVSLVGSFFGSLVAFFLGRYCMRSSVRKWSRKYPMFDAIDAGKYNGWPMRNFDRSYQHL